MQSATVKKNIATCFALAMLLSACSKLELVPISQKSVENFYKTPTDINQAVIGCYNGLRTVWVTAQSSYMLTESRSDNAFQGTAYDDGPICRWQETPDLPTLFTAWSTYYTDINRCNRILESVGNVTLPDSLKNQYTGEAKFARAMFYFDLVRLFGGVPIVTATISLGESYKVSRASVQETYDLIVGDLKDAASLLPDTYASTDNGRATKWAAKAYLGKVYLFRSGFPLNKGEWDLARQAFSEVIGSHKFQFFTNYADIYSFTNESKAQQVFSIQFKAGADGNGNPFPTRNAPNDIIPGTVAQGGIPFGGSPFNLFVSADLVNSFEPGDLRKSVAIRQSYVNKGNQTITTVPFCQKYQNGTVAALNDWDIDWIAMSYTDVLMMYAECLNELGYVPDGEAFQVLNDVRQRAGLAAKTSTDVPDQTAFRLWMEKERRWELCFENVRWFDLVRTDRALAVMKAFLTQYGMGDNVVSKDQYIYPIPQTVIDVSPIITQNP